MTPGRRGGGAQQPAARRRPALAQAALAAALLAALAACGPGGGGPAAAAAAGTNNEVSVPMTVVKHGDATLAVVPVMIDGKGPFRFLLDTGSSISSVNVALAQQLGLPTTGTTRMVRGVATTTTTNLVKVDNWQLGPATLAPEQIATIDMGPIGGGGLAGLLGSDELARFGSVVIDYRGQVLRFPPHQG